MPLTRNIAGGPIPSRLNEARTIGSIAAPTVDSVFAANRDTLIALCHEAIERGDHARAAWLANQIMALEGK